MRSRVDKAEVGIRIRSKLRQNGHGCFQALSVRLRHELRIGLHVTDHCRSSSSCAPSTLLLIQPPDISFRSKIQDTVILLFIPSQPCHRPLSPPPPMAGVKSPPTPAPQATWTTSHACQSTRRKQTTSHPVRTSRIFPTSSRTLSSNRPLTHSLTDPHSILQYRANTSHRAKTPPSHP